jgi:hypothetical protein
VSGGYSRGGPGGDPLHRVRAEVRRRAAHGAVPSAAARVACAQRQRLQGQRGASPAQRSRGLITGKKKAERRGRRPETSPDERVGPRLQLGGDARAGGRGAVPGRARPQPRRRHGSGRRRREREARRDGHCSKLGWLDSPAGVVFR